MNVHDIHHRTRAGIAFVPVDRISEPSFAHSSLVSAFGFAMMPVMENRVCLGRRLTELVHLLFRFLRVTLTVICTSAPLLAETRVHVRYVSHTDHVSTTHHTEHTCGKPAMFSSLLIGRVRIHAIECVLCVNCAAFVLRRIVVQSVENCGRMRKLGCRQ